MDPTNDTKMQVKIMATVLLLSLGIAFGGQYVFNKCFVEKADKVDNFASNKNIMMADTLRNHVVDTLIQQQR